MADNADPAPLPTNDADPPAAPEQPAQPPEPEGEPKPAEAPKADEPPAPAAAEPPADDATPAAEDPKPPADDDEARKAYNNEQAQRRIADRARLKSETQSNLSQQFKPETAEDLIQKGYEPNDARLEAMEQRLQAQEIVSQVADLTANMNVDAQAVEADFPIFRESNPDGSANADFDKSFAEKVARDYIRDADVKFDQTGQYVLSARVSMYDYMKSRAEDRLAGMAAGKADGQRAAERMLASAETPPGQGPSHKASNPDGQDHLRDLWS